MVFEKFPQNHFASQILTQFASVCLFNSQMDISALHLYTFFFFLWGNRIAYKCCILSRPFFPDLTPPHRHVPVSDPLALCAKFQWIFALNACACSLNKRNNLNGNPVPNWGAMVTMSAGGGGGDGDVYAFGGHHWKCQKTKWLHNWQSLAVLWILLLTVHSIKFWLTDQKETKVAVKSFATVYQHKKNGNKWNAIVDYHVLYL